MLDAGWLFGKEEHSDAQLVIVEEAADADAQAATSGDQAAKPACGSSNDNGGDQADTSGSEQAATTAPKRSRNDDTQAAADNNEQPEPAAKRSRADGSGEGQVVLPIHKLIVMSASEFCKARLGAWQQSNTERCRVVLHVPPGQLEVGRRLVRAMYEDAPSFDDLSSEQRFQLFRLADRYGAPKVAKAAAAAVGIDAAVMDDKGLAWAAVLAAYPADFRGLFREEASEDDVPSPAPELQQPPAPALRQYADDTLQLLLGDLEAVWASADNDEKRRDLLSLPRTALMALLADERTRVANENTVVHTILSWADKHELDPSSAEARQLLTLVRVARLTPHYARTVFCKSEIAKQWMDARELTHASMLPLLEDGGVSGWDDREDWIEPARPRSALADALVLEWSPRLVELESCVTAMLTQGKRQSSIDGPKGVVWQGWPLHLRIDCERSACGGLTLGFYLAAKKPCRKAGALIEFSLEAMAVGGGGALSRPSLCLFSLADFVGVDDFFGLAKAGGGDGSARLPADWAGVEAALRAQRLVHGDGDAAHLKLRSEVTRLL
jgi:hypothetical protein